MDTTAVAGSLLPKLLEFSLTLTLLAVILGLSLYANFKQWRKSEETAAAHAAELSSLNDKRLNESKEFAKSREENSTQMRELLGKFGQVLTNIEQRGQSDERSHRLLLAVADALKIPLRDYL